MPIQLARIWLFSPILVFALTLGCGPITSMGVIKDARTAITSAKIAGAEKGAPYEYFSAVEHLHKAREEQGYSDYQAAIDLAQKAIKFADTARAKASAGGDPLQRIDPKRARAVKKEADK